MPDQQPLEVKTYTVDPRDLTPLDKNARRMPARDFNQLVKNIERDGTLTSVPLVHRSGEKLVILSGNHPVKAAVAAGLATIAVMEVAGDLSPERLVAMQLSHNAIVGEDDQNVLRELYDSLGVLEQLYSGLTDASFGNITSLDLTKLTIGAPKYQEVNLLFLPEDRETFIETMEKLGKKAAAAKRYVGRLEDFEQFEKAIVAVQDTLNVHNQALIIHAMAELALERLEQMEQADGEAVDGEGGEADPSKHEATTEHADGKGGRGRSARKRGDPVDRG